MKRVVLFVLCGGAAAGINVLSRWILSNWLPYAAAIVVAFILGLVSGFLLFKFLVFDSANSKRIGKESFWYILVNAFALVQTLIISIFLADYFFPWVGMSLYPHDVAHVIGVGLPVITSYFGHKYITFK